MHDPRRLLLLSTLGVLGCGAEAPETVPPTPVWGVRVAAASAKTCVDGQNGNNDFPGGIESLELRITGKGYTPVARTLSRTSLDAAGQILVTSLPPGTGLTLSLFGCDGQSVAWSALASPVDITAGAKVAPQFFFTRRGAFSCSGSDFGGSTWVNAPANGLAFAGTVTAPDGRVLLVGGFGAYAGTAPNLKTGGASKIWEYRPDVGRFRDFGAELLSARGWHHVVSVDGGRKAIVLGGVTEASFDTSALLPSGPRPATAVEVVDVEARTVAAAAGALAGVNALPMGTLTTSADGLSWVLAGGREPSADPSTNVTRVSAGSAADLAAGTVTVDATGTLAVARAAHTATLLSGGHLVLVGGNFDDTDANVVEVVRAGATQGELAQIQAGSVAVRPFGLHTAVLLKEETGCRADLLVAGGARALKNPGATAFASAAVDPGRLLGVTVDVCGGAAPRVTFRDLSGGVSENSRLKRALHRATLVEEGRAVLLTGGYASFSDGSGAACEDTKKTFGCYLADALRLTVSGDRVGALTVADPGPIAMQHPRFGHVAVALTDGTVLVVGGVQANDSNADGNTLLNHAELYNPPRNDGSVCQ